MTRTEIENSLKDLNGLVMEGKLIDAFDKYYHDEVEMQENEMPPTVSKEINRQREIEFLNSITEFRNAEVRAVAVGDNISFVIWDYDYSHKEWGVRKYRQVSVQEWHEGKIIKERFIYTN
jgi:hypothetical protein